MLRTKSILFKYIMLYLIDAYNYLAYVTGYKTCSARQIRSVLLGLERALALHDDQAIVVFDGGVLAHRESSCVGVCTIIYPGTGLTADQYLLDIMNTYRPGQAAVVTADREIIAGASSRGHHTVRPYEFQKLVQERLRTPEFSPKSHSGTIKYTDYQSTGEIDKIMEEAAAVPYGLDKDVDADS
jgi:hypothetical protein